MGNSTNTGPGVSDCAICIALRTKLGISRTLEKKFASTITVFHWHNIALAKTRGGGKEVGWPSITL